MRNLKSLVLSQVSQSLERYQVMTNDLPPPTGWVNTIRTALGMSLAQLSDRLGVSGEAVRQLEKREAEGGTTLNALRTAAAALDMQLVYAIVPRSGTLEELYEQRARNLARRIILRTHQQMILEDQAVPDPAIEQAIEEATQEIMRSGSSKLWDPN